MSRGISAKPSRGSRFDSLAKAWKQTPLSLKIMMVISTISTLTIALRPQPQLLWHPFIEDAYYALSVSRNLASGSGLTIDGETWTNGFQPLTTIIYAIPFLGPQSDAETLRIILIFQWLLLQSTAVVLGLIVRTFVSMSRLAPYAFGVGFLTFTGSFFVINTSLNGLETGALLFAYAVLWRYFQTHDLATTRNALVFGLLVGVTGLVRIDSMVIALVIAVGVAIMYGLRSAIALLTATFVVVLPWLLYGLILTGNPVPSSGRAQTSVEFSSYRLEQIAEAIAAAGIPWLPISTLAPNFSTAIRLAFLVILVAGFIMLTRTRLSPTAKGETEAFAVFLTGGVMTLAFYYGTTSFATWFYGRYLAPLSVVTAFLLAVCVVLIGRTLLMATATLLTATAVVASVSHWLNGFYQENTMLTEQVALVERTVPPHEIVAAAQTGTLGFFRPNTVNLDGKVNDQILQYPGSTSEYLAERSIVWFCDWPRMINDFLQEDAERWEIVSEEGTFACARQAIAGQ